MSMTVLQLLPELEVGGVEQGTLEIAEALITAGHRAVVVSGGGRMVPRLEQLGALHVTLPIGRKRPSTLRTVRLLRDLMLREQINVVHARSRLPAWIGRLALNGIDSARRPRWVTTVHGPYTVNRYSRIMVSGERVIAISEFIRDYIFHAYPKTDPSNVCVVPRGVDRAHYAFGFMPDPAWRAAFHAAYPSVEGNRVLCLPARLTRWKGQLDFIQMMALLTRKGLPVHGLIVGGPHPRKCEYEIELKRVVHDLGLDKQISFLGQRSDMREILAISDLVFSLTREPEAFGRTTVEALSLGRPVIGYDHGGTGEILRGVYPMGLVPMGAIDEAARRATALLQAAAPVPRDHPYTLSAMQAGTLAVYNSLWR
jgi:glycosyltransferase involved in cell wall biosynthesis